MTRARESPGILADDLTKRFKSCKIKGKGQITMNPTTNTKATFIYAVASRFFAQAKDLVDRGLIRPCHSILVRTEASQFWDSWKFGCDMTGREVVSIWTFAQMGMNVREPLPGDDTDDGTNRLVEEVREAAGKQYPGQCPFLIDDAGYYGDLAQLSPNIYQVCLDVAGLKASPMPGDPRLTSTLDDILNG